MKLRKNLVLLLIGLAWASCSKVTVEELPSEGKVTISMDWAGYESLPTGMRFYFYRIAGPTEGTRSPQASLVLEGAASGFTGSLPVGVYRMVGVNTDVSGIELQGMESYETATAAMVSGGLPQNLYCCSAEAMTVSYEAEAKEAIRPEMLIRKLGLRFSIEGAGVRLLTGTIGGLYPSLLLCSQKPSPESLAASANTYREFDVALTGESGTAILPIFGILNPENGTRYANVLKLKATTTSGSVQTLEVDLSKTLTEILAANNGSLPPGETVEIEIGLTVGAEIGLIARVAGWKLGSGNGEVEE